MATSKKKAAAPPAEETEKKVAAKKPALPDQYQGNVQQFMADCNATKRNEWPEEWHAPYEHYSR